MLSNLFLLHLREIWESEEVLQPCCGSHLDSSRFPCCVLLALSWNTIENPTTDLGWVGQSITWMIMWWQMNNNDDIDNNNCNDNNHDNDNVVVHTLDGWWMSNATGMLWQLWVQRALETICEQVKTRVLPSVFIFTIYLKPIEKKHNMPFWSDQSSIVV